MLKSLPVRNVRPIKEHDQLIKKTFDASSASPGWIQGKFTFEDQPLSVVVDELERQYDVTVKLAPGIEDTRYTGLFESGDLEKAVNLIPWPLHLKAEISGKTISYIPMILYESIIDQNFFDLNSTWYYKSLVWPGAGI